MAKKPRYQEIDGLLLPPTFTPEDFKTAVKFKPGKDDVVVATFPKCGTTWALQIVVLILRKGVPPKDSEEYFACTPFLEMTSNKELAGMARPGCIKTHLPYHFLNFSKESKYIYVARHPADCVVSFYHHTRFFPIYFFSDGSFNDFFEIFIRGETDWNDYFDHLLSWYEHRHEPNVLFLTYESMMADKRGAILKMARFLGEEHYHCLIDNDEEILNKVLEYSSVEFMKSTVDLYWKESFTSPPSIKVQEQNATMKNYAFWMEEAAKCGHVSTGDFVRKGVVGEGKIKLSKVQVEQLEQRIKEKTSHSDVMDLWKNK